MQEKSTRVLEELQQKLSRSDAGDIWLPVGDAIADLESLARRSEDGRSWSEVVRDFHEGLGYRGLSMGHIQRVRRVRNFVRKALEDEGVSLTDAEILAAQVSSLEVAERLHMIDPERGLAALLSCIHDRRRFVEMRREYEEYLQQNVHRLPKKQATWLKKRKSLSGDSAALVERVLLAESAVIFGSSSVVFRPFEPSKLSPSLKATDFGFRITDQSGLRMLGVEMLTLPPFSKQVMVELLAQLEIRASFFDLYWVFSTSDVTKIAWFASLLDDIRIDRVGLLRLAGDEWEVVRCPNPNPRVSDRRALIRLP